MFSINVTELKSRQRQRGLGEASGATTLVTLRGPNENGLLLPAILSGFLRLGMEVRHMRVTTANPTANLTFHLKSAKAGAAADVSAALHEFFMTKKSELGGSDEGRIEDWLAEPQRSCDICGGLRQSGRLTFYSQLAMIQKYCHRASTDRMSLGSSKCEGYSPNASSRESNHTPTRSPTRARACSASWTRAGAGWEPDSPPANSARTFRDLTTGFGSPIPLPSGSNLQVPLHWGASGMFPDDCLEMGKAPAKRLSPIPSFDKQDSSSTSLEEDSNSSVAMKEPAMTPPHAPEYMDALTDWWWKERTMEDAARRTVHAALSPLVTRSLRGSGHSPCPPVEEDSEVPQTAGCEDEEVYVCLCPTSQRRRRHRSLTRSRSHSSSTSHHLSSSASHPLLTTTTASNHSILQRSKSAKASREMTEVPTTEELEFVDSPNIRIHPASPPPTKVVRVPEASQQLPLSRRSKSLPASRFHQKQRKRLCFMKTDGHRAHLRIPRRNCCQFRSGITLSRLPIRVTQAQPVSRHTAKLHLTAFDHPGNAAAVVLALHDDQFEIRQAVVSTGHRNGVPIVRHKYQVAISSALCQSPVSRCSFASLPIPSSPTDSPDSGGYLFMHARADEVSPQPRRRGSSSCTPPPSHPFTPRTPRVAGAPIWDVRRRVRRCLGAQKKEDNDIKSPKSSRAGRDSGRSPGDCEALTRKLDAIMALFENGLPLPIGIEYHPAVEIALPNLDPTSARVLEILRKRPHREVHHLLRHSPSSRGPSPSPSTSCSSSLVPHHHHSHSSSNNKHDFDGCSFDFPVVSRLFNFSRFWKKATHQSSTSVRATKEQRNQRAATEKDWHPLFCRYPQMGIYHPGMRVIEFVYSNGDRYRGQSWGKMRHGTGTYLYHKRSNFIRYEGQWLFNMKHGNGSLYCKDDVLYSGQWKANAFDGHGVLLPGKSPNAYEGRFTGGRKEGLGVLKEGASGLYLGRFSEDEKHGAGLSVVTGGALGPTNHTTLCYIWRRGQPVFKSSADEVWRTLAPEDRGAPFNPLQWSPLDLEHWMLLLGFSREKSKQSGKLGIDGVAVVEMLGFGRQKAPVEKPNTLSVLGQRPTPCEHRDTITKLCNDASVIFGCLSGRRLMWLFVQCLLKHQTRMSERKALWGFRLISESEARALTQHLIPFCDVRLLEVIGEGGYGRVRRALWNGTFVAVKDLLAESMTPAQLRSFVEEARTLSTLRHPNIALFLGVCIPALETKYGCAKNTQCFTSVDPASISRSLTPTNQKTTAESPLLLLTEYLPSGTLFDLIHRPSRAVPEVEDEFGSSRTPEISSRSSEGDSESGISSDSGSETSHSDSDRDLSDSNRHELPRGAPTARRALFGSRFRPSNLLPVTIVLDISLGISSAMTYLHQRGILHCDLKSCNVLLDKSLHPKLCDFGLSIQRPTPGGALVSRPQSTKIGAIGTPHWAAPEVLRGDSHTAKSDVYSFGVILWEMLGRQLPYPSLSVSQIFAAVGWGMSSPPRIRGLTAGWLEMLMRVCLHPDPDLRPSFANITKTLELFKQKTSEEPLREMEDFFFGSR